MMFTKTDSGADDGAGFCLSETVRTYRMEACTSVAGMLRDIGMRSEWCVSGKEAVVRSEEAFAIHDRYEAYIIDWMRWSNCIFYFRYRFMFRIAYKSRSSPGRPAFYFNFFITGDNIMITEVRSSCAILYSIRIFIAG